MKKTIEHLWSDTDGWEGTELLRENPAPVSRCRAQIIHGQAWDQTRASLVRRRRLTA